MKSPPPRLPAGGRKENLGAGRIGPRMERSLRDEPEDKHPDPEKRSRNGGRSGSKRVTMTDVARLAACSQSTVSVVLNNTPGIRISKTTRERVIKAAEDVGYEIIPGHAALSDRPRQIAVIFDRIATSPEAVVSIDGARETAWTTGHIVAVAQTLNDPEMEPTTIQAMLRNGVDAVVYATIMTRKVEVPRLLYSARVPVVLLNCYSEDRAFPSVLPGEVAGGPAPPMPCSGRPPPGRDHHWRDVDGRRPRPPARLSPVARHRRHPYDPALVREGKADQRRLRAHPCADGPARPTDGDLLLQRPHGGRLLSGAEGTRRVDPRRCFGDRLRRRGGRPAPLAATHQPLSCHIARWVAGRSSAPSRSPRPARQAADHQARMPADRTQFDRRGAVAGGIRLTIHRTECGTRVRGRRRSTLREGPDDLGSPRRMSAAIRVIG